MYFERAFGSRNDVRYDNYIGYATIYAFDSITILILKLYMMRTERSVPYAPYSFKV